jgi:hypothetical protein
MTRPTLFSTHVKSATFFGGHTKDTNMTNLDAVLAALSHLDAESKRDLIDRLSTANLAEMQIAAADTAKKTRTAKLLELRASRDPAFLNVEGGLARVGIAVEEIFDVRSLDKLFAAARRPLTDIARMEIKSGLAQLGFI